MTDIMECDVLIVGGGPAGLSAAIRFKQLVPDCNVILLEKGSEVGAHILSGAVFDPIGLNELIPDWKDRGAPLNVPVVSDHFSFLTATRRIALPTPAPMKNHGNYIISLANLCRWLATQATELGVQIFPGFPAAEVIIEEGVVRGVRTGAFGIGKDGSHKHSYQPPMELRARVTLFAEGCRGSLTEKLVKEFGLRGEGDATRSVHSPLAGESKSAGSVSSVATTDGKGISVGGGEVVRDLSDAPLPSPSPAKGEGTTERVAVPPSDPRSLIPDPCPQTYGLGIKEIWQVAPEKHRQGRVEHTVGWPMDRRTYGGSFIYHLEDNQVAVGFVVGLDYENPYLDPFKEFQRFKTHPAVRPLFEGGKRLAYGARALNEGGWQSIPRLAFPGGALIGCAAGFLNVPRIKGSHLAMKSGMLAAEAIVRQVDTCQYLLQRVRQPDDAPEEVTETPAPFAPLSAEDNRVIYDSEFDRYEKDLCASWLGKELHRVRNIRPAFRYGLWAGLLYAALDTYLFRGRAPWTLKHHADHAALKPADQCKKIEYPAPDGVVSFDRLSSVYLSNTNHEEDQPAHLTLKDATVPVATNLAVYDGPEARFCPAGVYEFVESESRITNHESRKLHINAQNCVHCKTCDIKDPTQNIVWTTPEGGGGPNYGNM